MNYSDWKTTQIDPVNIKLDALNPRVFLNKYTQKNIRKFLIEHFDVLELANSIIENGGLPPMERILCIKEGNDIIVVEGNRRVTACQILKNPDLIPSNLKHKVINNSKAKEMLDTIEIIIAPNRDVTENYITMRHTDSGIKRWSRLAENRRYILRYKKGQSIRHISQILNVTEYNVRKGIQFYYFIEYIRNSIDWSDAEKDILNNPLLETSKLDRFLPFSTPAKEILTISFNANNQLKYKIDKANFNSALKSIVKDIFIEDKINTRTPLNDVFNDNIKMICRLKTKSKQIIADIDTSISAEPDIKEPIENDSKPTDKKLNDKSEKKNIEDNKPEKTRPKKPKPKVLKPQSRPSDRKYLFEGIIYSGNVIGISHTLYELHKIIISNFPFSSTVLIRTLIECTIQEFIVKNNIEIKIKKNNDIKNLSIDTLLQTCTNKDNGNYQNLRKFNHTVARIINEANGKRDADELNIVTHGVYREPSVQALLDIERRWFSAIQIMINHLPGQ